MSTRELVALALAAGAGMTQAAAPAANPAADPAAMRQLVEAVSLDVVSEAAVGACEDLGTAAAPRVREAWIAWRGRHQVAPLRVVLTRMMERRSSNPPWDGLAKPARQKLLDSPDPERACDGVQRELQGAGMDVSARYPQAPAVARGLVQANLVMAPTPLPVAVEPARGQVLLPTQVVALTEQRGNWLALSEEAARRRMGPVYVKGRVARSELRSENFNLIVAQGDRVSPQQINLSFNAESWIGREIVLRGVVTSLSRLSMDLADAALVSDASGLTVSPLPQTPLTRKPVLAQRVTTPPGKGLGERELAAVVVHGEANNNYGTRWEEDVRFLLKDGSVYRDAETLPPDQLDAAASRRLEPQRWGRWRAAGKGYEMQAQDEEGRPSGDWKPERHEAVRPWAADTRLEGSFTRSAFTGSMVTGGTSSTHAIRFTKDGRFERSFSALSSTGSLQAITGTVVAGSSQGDGKGSSRTGGATVGTGTGTVGVSSGTQTKDDGASRRGRYRLDGYAIALEYDDGHKERLLSFPVDAGNRSVFIGTGSYDRAK